MSVDITVVQQL